MTATIKPTAEQISQTRQAIDSYIQSIDTHPHRRVGAYPYYRFHEADTPIRGTVLIFHGFSAKPDQMWRLADYLFQNGYNFYQCSLAGHPWVPPSQYWPQVDLKPEIYNPLREKVAQDPVLSTYFANLAASNGKFQRPSFQERQALVARLMELDPRLLDIAKAIRKSNDPDFDRCFTSSHMNYLENARDRLRELDAMPGPIYTVGLSVGGAVALALAADRSDRIQRVVAYAPLLRIYGKERREYVMLSGPLDISELGWDPNLRFPVGCLTAADRFGSSAILTSPAIRALKRIPTFLVLTENEDAADIETSQTFFKKIGGRGQGHCSYLYPAKDLVPHPMVDPTEVSQGMSNRFWRSLYQETFRFLDTAKVDTSNMSNLELDPNLPAVPPVEKS
ncbi:alpha/beta hydrolase [Geitlerinema sp. PCC 9228]|uniref:alpha/beta hydrolase n=1 Tax=Geitlerinema sp. PCC 9228 TaxID=111611 RepID=UPI0008F9A0D9|nr:alpha/beta hydrolase [Geitlerinema sp. PCC 9228]